VITGWSQVTVADAIEDVSYTAKIQRKDFLGEKASLMAIGMTAETFTTSRNR